MENDNIQGSDSPARSFVKAMSWRVTALIVTVTIVCLVTEVDPISWTE